MTTIKNRTCANTFVKTIESFAKRSKYITIRHKYVGYDFCGVQVNVTKKNRVVREMMDYMASLLPVVEEEDLHVLTATWYKSHAEGQTEDGYVVQCCVSYH